MAHLARHSTVQERLTRFEEWRARAERQTPREVVFDLETRAKELEARVKAMRNPIVTEAPVYADDPRNERTRPDEPYPFWKEPGQ